MGRKQELSQDQWVEVAKRLLAGDSTYDVARDFNVAESTIRSHFQRKTAAATNAEVRAAVAAADAATSIIVPSDDDARADDAATLLRDISLTFLRTARISANSALRYAVLENAEAQKIDDAQPMKSEQSMKAAAILGRLKNDALDPARSLLMASANKELLQRAMDEAGKAVGTNDITPERQKEAMRRFAFLLARMATEEET